LAIELEPLNLSLKTPPIIFEKKHKNKFIKPLNIANSEENNVNLFIKK
jgi:hypothetical protein